MAEGGGEFGYKDPDLDNRIDHDDENEINRTQPFDPGAASNPYQPGDPNHSDEQTEMSTFRHEQSGLPDTSYAETSFIFGENIPLLKPFIHTDDKPALLEKAKDFIRRRFPNVKFGKIDPIGFSKKAGKDTEIVTFGPRGGESKVFLSGGKGLQKSFIDKFSTALGSSAEDIIAEDRDTIIEERQRLKETEIKKNRLKHSLRKEKKKRKKWKP